MKPLNQALICLIWIFLVFYIISRPPNPPRAFPEQKQTLVPSREVYNPSLAASLDQGLRDFWHKPDQVLERLGNLDGLKIADIGCGEGYFTLRLLEKIGPQGRVYATDIQSEVLETLNQRIPDHLSDRATLILSSENDTGVPEPVDLILLIQVFGEVSNQSAFLQGLKEIMHANTRIVMIDSKHITEPSNGFTRPLNLQKLIRELQAEGLVFPTDYDSTDYDFLPKQFFFILKLATP